MSNNPLLLPSDHHLKNRDLLGEGNSKGIKAGILRFLYFSRKKYSYAQRARQIRQNFTVIFTTVSRTHSW